MGENRYNKTELLLSFSPAKRKIKLFRQMFQIWERSYSPRD